MLSIITSAILASVALLPAVCSGNPIVSQRQTVCNNSPALCGRAYNNVTHLGAHDSPFVRNSTNDYDIAGDQFYSAVDALSAGVRLLSGQVHEYNSSNGTTEWHLCHTSCLLYDAGPLSTWLAGIKAWMDDNPTDVVTVLIVNSDNANATILDQQFSESGIKEYAFTPAETTQATTSWPTLGSLISKKTRLMAFIASLDPADNKVAPYLMDEFTFIFENPYENTSPSDFNCTANRPSQLNGNTTGALASGRMALMNHFLYDDIAGIDIPAVEDVDNTNAQNGTTGNLGASAAQCTAEYHHPPQFILVDFWNVGPAIATVDTLNGVTNPVGRNNSYPTTSQESENPSSLSPSETDSSSSTTAGPTSRLPSVSASATAHKSSARPSYTVLKTRDGHVLRSDGVLFTLVVAVVLVPSIIGFLFD